MFKYFYKLDKKIFAKILNIINNQRNVVPDLFKSSLVKYERYANSNTSDVQKAFGDGVAVLFTSNIK